MHERYGAQTGSSAQLPNRLLHPTVSFACTTHMTHPPLGRDTFVSQTVAEQSE